MENRLPFDISHLNNYAIVKEPCTAIVKCNSNPDFDNPYSDGSNPRWIINLKAVTQDSLDVIKYFVTVNKNLTYDDIGYMLLKGAIWENQIWDKLQLPVKGEEVIATFDYVKEKLMCTNITIIPKVNLELFKPSKETLEDIEFFKNINK